MRLQNPFAAISTTGLDSQVLTVLARSTQFFTIPQVHGLLPEGGSVQGVRNSLERLAEQGILDSYSFGRSLAYTLNKEHVLVNAILEISRAKDLFISRLVERVESWTVQPLTMSLFGSAVRSEMSTKSDIDLFIVFADDAPDDALDDQIGGLASDARRWSGNDVRPLVYRCSEVTDAAIFASILQDGVTVMGEPTWLRGRIARSRRSA